MDLGKACIIAGVTTLIAMLGRHAAMSLGASGNFSIVASVWWFWMGFATLIMSVGFIAVIYIGYIGLKEGCFRRYISEIPAPQLQN